jgi:tetratricopeptide (TPR) repeat protein
MKKHKPRISCLLASALTVLTVVVSAPVSSKVIMPEWYHKQMSAYSLKGTAREQRLLESLASAKIFAQADCYPQSEIIFSLGQYYWEIGELAKAEKSFSEAVRLKQDGLAISLIGKQRQSANDPTAAAIGIVLPAYSTARDEQAGRIHSLANCQSWLGRTLLQEKNYEAAARVLASAIALLDQNQSEDKEVILLPDTLLPYAKALRALKRTDEASLAEARAHELLRQRKLLLD